MNAPRQLPHKRQSGSPVFSCALIALLLALVAVISPWHVAAQELPSHHWSSNDVTITVQGDGSLDVTERLELVADAGTSYGTYHNIDTTETAGIGNIHVAEEGAGNYSPDNSDFDFGKEIYGPPRTFQSQDVGKQKQIVWFFDPLPSHAHKTFVVTYTVSAALRLTDGGDHLNWQPFLSGERIDQARLTVIVPPGVDLKDPSAIAGIYPPDAGKVDISGHQAIFTTIRPLKADSTFRAWMRWPHGAITAAAADWQDAEYRALLGEAEQPRSHHVGSDAITVTVKPDASLDVVERQEIVFDQGTFRAGYRFFDTQKMGTITNLRVTEEGAGAYTPDDTFFDIANAYYGPPGTFDEVDRSGLLAVSWFYDQVQAPDTRTIVISFTARDGVALSPGGDRFDWSPFFWPQRVPDPNTAIDRPMLTVQLPPAVNMQDPAVQAGLLPATAGSVQLGAHSATFTSNRPLNADRPFAVSVGWPHGAASGLPPAWQTAAAASEHQAHQDRLIVGLGAGLLLILLGGIAVWGVRWYRRGSAPDGNAAEAREVPTPTPASLNTMKRAARHEASAADRTLRAVLGRTGSLLARSPVVWVYALAIAFLGWTSLPAALVAAGVRSSDNPVGRGGLGLGLVVAFAIVALLLEVALVRTLTAEQGGAGAALISSMAQIGRIAGFWGASVLTAFIVALCISAPLWWLVSTLAGAIVNFLTLGFATILLLVVTALSLVLPFWIFMPLGLRALAIGGRGVLEALTDAFTLTFERARLILFAFVVWLALGLAILGLGTQLQARDLSLLSLLGVVTEWAGSSTIAGAAMLALTAVATAFVAALWTAVYQALAAPLGLDLPGTAEMTPDADETRREAIWLVPQFGKAVAAVRRAPGLLLLAGIAAFLGTPTAADLLSYYNLVPRPDQSANQNISTSLAEALPFSGGQLVLMYVIFFIISLVFSAALVVAGADSLSGRPARLGTALRVGLTRLPRVLFAELVWFAVVGMIGAIVWIAVLLGLALIVQMVPGLDPLTEAVQWPVILLTLFAATGLMPFIARAVLLDNAPALTAYQRALDTARSRPMPVVVVFLFTFALDVLRGPVAALGGLITNGWSTLAAVVFRNSLNQSVGGWTVAASVVFFLVSVVVIAFKALLWTQVYLQTAPALYPPKVTRPAPEPPSLHPPDAHHWPELSSAPEATFPVQAVSAEPADDSASA